MMLALYIIAGIFLLAFGYHIMINLKLYTCQWRHTSTTAIK